MIAYSIPGEAKDPSAASILTLYFFNDVLRTQVMEVIVELGILDPDPTLCSQLRHTTALRATIHSDTKSDTT